jgi:hypothetical protein
VVILALSVSSILSVLSWQASMPTKSPTVGTNVPALWSWGMGKEELFADMMAIEWFDDYTTRYRQRKMPVANPFR